MTTLTLKAQLKASSIQKALEQLVGTDMTELATLANNGTVELVDEDTGEVKKLTLTTLLTMWFKQTTKLDTDHPW